MEGRYPLGWSFKQLTNILLLFHGILYCSLEVKYGYMICFSQRNVSKSNILHLLDRSSKTRSAICYVLFHLSFPSLCYPYWQCSIRRLFHQPGLQKEDNLKQNSLTCRMTSSMRKINLYCLKPVTNEGQFGNIYWIYKCIFPQICLQNDVIGAHLQHGLL